MKAWLVVVELDLVVVVLVLPVVLDEVELAVVTLLVLLKAERAKLLVVDRLPLEVVGEVLLAVGETPVVELGLLEVEL